MRVRGPQLADGTDRRLVRRPAGRASFSAQVQGGAAAGAHFEATDPSLRLSAPPCVGPGDDLTAGLRGPPQGQSWLFASLERTSLLLPPFGELGLGPDSICWLSGPDLCPPDWNAQAFGWTIPPLAWGGVQVHLQALAWDPVGQPLRLSGVASVRLD